ncbi:MAG: alkaline shock response membrane anchor protein AmaP [Candidatus Omnitrophica bacterium]|nr:alkaline shock response membrane anchor protein AmaP [Candidatus Omnitrophota bacterium]
MRLFTILGIIFYTTVISLVGVIFILTAFNLLPLNLINLWSDYLHTNLQAKIVVGGIGLLLILISISFAELILGKIQREKTIAFNNPSGQVTISLSAVEDLIVRLLRSISDIKDVKPNVIATKKGIEIDLRISLRSETNIPELTMSLQDTLRNKIQEILGIEEPITIRVHVVKIISKEEKESSIKKEEPPIPFRGYGKI